MLVSCGVQSRLNNAKRIAQLAEKNVKDEQQQIDSTLNVAKDKLSKGEVDSTIKLEFENVLSKLAQNLASIESRIAALDSFLNDKSSFRGHKFKSGPSVNIAQIDSFNLLKEKRDTIYKLIQESVSSKAFSLFKMGAFFESGVYRIPPSASTYINNAYRPILDSIQRISNKYNQIPRSARLVFVGYADASPIAEGSSLYNELSRYSTTAAPPSAELNRVLSQLRANEMVRHMKIIVGNNSSKFESLPTLKISYHSYGRGEAYPNPSITDYRKNDERRRIVMCYWSILPDLEAVF